MSFKNKMGLKKPQKAKPPSSIQMPVCTEEPEGGLSPMTPSSQFSQGIIQNGKDSIFPIIALCYWDNIMGPKVRHVWLTKPDTPLLTKELLQHISSHTLNSEICRDPYEPQIDVRLNVAACKGMAFYSAIFGGAGKLEVCINSLCLIMRYRDFPHFLPIQDLVQLWMLRMITKLRAILDKCRDTFEDAMKVFQKSLEEFIQMTLSLREMKLPKPLPLADTAFHPDHKFDPKFLCQAITAHLISFGRTVVVGPSAGRVNLLISALSLLLGPMEQECCRFVSEKKTLPYHHDLCVQGLVKGLKKELDGSLSDVVYSHYPTTLVDVSQFRIFQTQPYLDHQAQRQDAHTQEILAWWRGQDKPRDKIWDLFQPVDHRETLVSAFIGQLQQLPYSPGVREGLIHNFCVSLHKKAVALNQTVQEMMKDGQKVQIKSQLKKLRKKLNLEAHGDFLVVMAVAEKLRPGLHNLMYGDTRQELDYQRRLLQNY